MNTLHSRMTTEYQGAVHFAEAYGVHHYNLGLAERGDDDLLHVQERMVWRLVGDTPIGSDTTLVDVGAGIGGALYEIAAARHPHRSIGVELCWPNIVHGMKRGAAGGPNGVRFVQGDAHALPFAEASVDVIFNLESAFHYPDKDRFIRECARVLRPGGRLLIGDLVRERWLPRFIGDRDGTRFWTLARYRDAIRDAGLRIDRCEDVRPEVIHSIDSVLAHVRRDRIRRWWPARRSLFGVLGARWLLGAGRLGYMLLRARR